MRCFHLAVKFTKMSSRSENEDEWDYLYADMKEFYHPIELEAEVVHGFKRGSKELGIPTANMSMEELGVKGEELETGIYYGLATLKDQQHKAVVSVGWNPYYQNTKKTVEAHLLAKLDDFYGERLQLSLLGYLRKETNFSSLGKHR
jgi:FAD synthase